MFNKLVIILIILSFPTFANSTEDKLPKKDLKTEVPNTTPTNIDIGSTHQYLSGQILGFADYIDSFFGRYTRTDKKNKSRIIIISKTKMDEKEGINSKIKIEARLNLPHLEELLKFKINKQKRIDNIEKYDLKKKSIEAVEEEEDSYYFVDWKLGSQVGVDVSLKPDIFANLTNKLELGGRKNIARIEDQIFIYGRSGLGNKLAIEFDHLVSKQLFLRLENSAIWREKTSEITYAHGPELYYSLTERSTLFFDIKARAQKTDLSNWSIKKYDSSLVYNKKLNLKWLLFKTGPAIEFAKEKDFKSKLSYFFQFEVYIGSF